MKSVWMERGQEEQQRESLQRSLGVFTLQLLVLIPDHIQTNTIPPILSSVYFGGSLKHIEMGVYTSCLLNKLYRF
jgi:hypothetical protein